jgi:hypothetical protein
MQLMVFTHKDRIHIFQVSDASTKMHTPDTSTLPNSREEQPLSPRCDSRLTNTADLYVLCTPKKTLKLSKALPAGYFHRFAVKVSTGNNLPPIFMTQTPANTPDTSTLPNSRVNSSSCAQPMLRQQLATIAE